nr:glycoside hydrolase family 18 [uncultured Chitinophaga sp.]
MRKTNLLLACGVSMFAILNSGCQKNLQMTDLAPLEKSAGTAVVTAATGADLLAYKNSTHQRMAGYFSGSLESLRQLPDSVDIINLWGRFENGADFQERLSIIHDLQKNKGIKFVVTGWLDDLNSRFGPKNSSGTVANANWRTGVLAMRDSIVKWGLDGIDFDIEDGIIPANQDTLVTMMTELARYFGPSSTPPSPGAPKFMFIWDSNKDGNYRPYQRTYQNYDLVYVQAYWRDTSSFTYTFNTYKNYIPFNKILVGVSFEDQTGFGDDQMPAYAAWNPAGSIKGGVFSYKIEVDYTKSDSVYNNYKYTRAAIQKMNPPATAAVTGVQFYQHTNYGGAVTGTIPKGSYTMAGFASYGMVNDWASSIKIPAGWTVVLYANDNFSGTSWTLSGNSANLGGLSPSANDKVSSFKIQ